MTTNGFFGQILRYLHPANRYENRLTDLKQYENDLNTKGIDYPVKLKDTTKFESLNPSLSGINVFSINDNNKFYPLRMAQRDPSKQSICFFTNVMVNIIIHSLKTFHDYLDLK